MRFLCDEMLKGLGRWLRTAGYDTAIADSATPDRMVVQQAREEQRILITRDRALARDEGSVEIVLLEQDGMTPCLREISERMELNWLNAPFSRCLVCNQPLMLATPEQRQRAPVDVQSNGDTMLYCAQCDSVYWHGSHTKRMLQRLNAFAAGDFSLADESGGKNG